MLRTHFRVSLARNRTYLVVPAIVVVVAVLVAPALAAYIGNADDGPPSMDDAREVAAIETSWGQAAQIWTAKASDGRSCEVFQIGEDRQEFNTDGMVVCRTAPQTKLPVRLGIQWFADGQGAFGVIASGRVDSSEVKDLAVQSTSGGRSPVAIAADGYFLTELPRSARPNSLSDDDPSPAIVARGQDGREVARIELKNFSRRP